MRRIPRKLMMWGGAATVAGAGFAFMTSNAVANSSAGIGGHSVSGYTVSTLTYTPQIYSPVPGGTTIGTHGVSARVKIITFKLTSNATTSDANGQPKTVAVYTTDATGNPNSGLMYAGTEPTGGWTVTGDGMTNVCTLGTWNYSGGHGYGTVTCNASLAAGFQTGALVSYTDLHVEANQ